MLKIRYSPWFGYSQIALGAGLNIVSFMLVKHPYNFIGYVLIIGGILTQIRPYFILYEDHLVFPARIGPVKRTYYFNSYSDISIKNKSLYVETTNKGLKKFTLKGVHRG